LVQAANDGYYPPGGLVALQQESKTMDLAGFNPGIDLNLTGQGETWRMEGSSVSVNLFEVLGVGTVLGRSFQSGDDRPGRDNLVILSHAAWQDKFHSDPAIVGRVIALGGVAGQNPIGKHLRVVFEGHWRTEDSRWRGRRCAPVRPGKPFS
jgi:hypothetical protein